MLAILTAGRINTGETPFRPKEKTVVCLTADRSPDGHGLTEGEVLRVGDPIFEHVAKRVGARPEDTYIAFADQKAVRLTVEVERGPKLKSWDRWVQEYYRRSPLPERRKVAEVCIFELSVRYPFGMEHVPASELASELDDLRRNPHKSKASTWWFYQGAIPSVCIVKVEHRQAGGEYVEVSGDVQAFLRPYVEQERLRMGA